MAPNAYDEVQIHTRRLLLRGASPSDATLLFPIFSDPQVMAYFGSTPHNTVEQTNTWVSSMISSPLNGVTDFIIVDLETSMPIGKVGIWDGNQIGFLLARHHWRHGLISEALDALLPYLFERKKYETIVADVDPRNAASLGALQKFGFMEIGRRERTFEIGKEWVDSVDLELTLGQWIERGSSNTDAGVVRVRHVHHCVTGCLSRLRSQWRRFKHSRHRDRAKS